MTYDNPSLTDMHRGIRDTLKKHWWLLMVEGVVLIILGVLAIAYPVAIVTAALAVVLGVLLIWKPATGAMSLTFAL